MPHRIQRIREKKMQALPLAKECYSMKLDLLTNATVVDDAIRFVSSKSKEKLKSSSEDDKEESREPDYDEDGDRLEEEETGEMTRYNKSSVLNLIRSSIVFD